MLMLSEHEPLAVALVSAIRTGDVRALKRLLADHPGLAAASIVEAGRRNGEACRSNGEAGKARSPLHIATDWPGHAPNVSATIALLIEAGADVNARFVGPHTETPLHWAASSDDVEALDALLAAGADIEATGAVIAGGTPLDDAVAFGQWRAAHRLVERGARTKLWHAAALGLMDRVRDRFAGADADAGAGAGADADADALPPHSEVTEAFWLACHGGQRQAAEYLLERGADLNWIGYDRLTPLDAARRSNADELTEWLLQQGAASAAGRR